MVNPPARTPKVVLFDLDGTLTDSASGILAGLRASLEAMNLPVPDEGTLRSFLGPPLAVTFKEHFGMSDAEIEKAIHHYRAYYHRGGELENSVYTGIPQVLSALHMRGVTLAVATSKPTVSATRILEHFNLAASFAVIAGAELDGSRQHKADVIAHALQGLDSPDVDDVVMIGDREHDVHGASAHGIRALGVLWGYGTADELRNAGASALLREPGEALQVLGFTDTPTFNP